MKREEKVKIIQSNTVDSILMLLLRILLKAPMKETSLIIKIIIFMGLEILILEINVNIIFPNNVIKNVIIVLD